MQLLDVRVDNLNEEELINKIKTFLDEEKFHQIATINPEFILTAQKKIEFKNILNDCNLNVADGFGIKCAFIKKGSRLQSRITGIDLMWKILKIASVRNFKIFLVANNRGLSSWEEARDAILKVYPNLEISGINCDKNSTDYAISSGTAIVFCNFGAPQQEKFLNGLKNDKIRLAMGIGGSFDFITGKMKRAPVFARRIGMEWLWRLIQQPKRLRRIFNSVIIFPIKIIFQ